MKAFHSVASTSFTLFFLAAAPLPAADPGTSDRPEALAAEVMKAAGIKNWPDVSEVKFTFNVDVDGERKVSAAHEWNVRTGKDTVSWGGKTATADVWNPDANKGDAVEAYRRWVNDAYWLLAPLKLGDKGVHLDEGGTVAVDGTPMPTLELSFGDVGLTSGDRYVLYIDPDTKLVHQWDYMPDEKTKKTATWEKYVEKGGLHLSTHHVMGNIEITITDLDVVTE